MTDTARQKLALPHQNGRPGLHQGSEPGEWEARDRCQKPHGEERRRCHNRVRHRVILSGERARKELWNQQQHNELEWSHLCQPALAQRSKAGPDKDVDENDSENGFHLSFPSPSLATTLREKRTSLGELSHCRCHDVPRPCRGDSRSPVPTARP